MASGGSSGRASSDLRSFDFGSDDVLCAYDDLINQDLNNGKRSDPSGKDFHESKTGRSLVNVYGQQDAYPKEEVISVVEKCMKKYADNLLHHLEGISGRLSQLEIYCYKLERSVGEFRADMIRDQSESVTKLNSLEKHLQEVHRSIQILRDKQELADTQSELAKLQFKPKESSTAPQKKTEEATAQSTVSEPKSQDNAQDIPNQHLALALPHQIPASRGPDQNQLPVQQLGPPQDRYIMNQSVPFYAQQSQPLQLDQQYIQHRPQIQTPPQYHQQWTQPPVAAPHQQPGTQAQLIRPQNPPTYLSYTPIQAATPETFSYSTVPQPGGTRGDPVSLTKVSGYFSPMPYPPQSNLHGYNTIYNVEGARVQTYPPTSYAPPSNQQVMRSHPYAEIIEKAVGMGYAREQVIAVVNTMEESGRPVDFNAVLDRLNSRPAAAGGAARVWTG